MREYLESTNLKFSNLLKWKISILRIFIGQVKSYLIGFSISKYKSVSYLKESKSGVAVICATGPSLQENKGSMRRLLQLAAKSDSLFVLNSYLLTDFGDIKPNYQFLVDTDHFTNRIHDPLIKIISENKDIKIVLRMQSKNVFKDNKIFYVSGINLPTFTKKINPKFIVGFFDQSILYALSLVSYMGYSKIILCGFDNNRFRQIVSVKPNQILFKGINVFSNGAVEEWSPRNNMIKVLNSHIMTLESLKLFNREKIFIVGETSFIDTFEKIEITEALKIIMANKK